MSARSQRANATLFESLEERRLFAAILVTNLGDSGAGSLRDAIVQANAGAGADSIQFDPALNGIITLTSGQLNISDTTGQTDIVGPGAGVVSVSANYASRIFEVAAGVSAAISGLTITKGQAPYDGTGTYLGAGIRNLGTLTLSDDVLTANGPPTTPSGPGGGSIDGAGVYSSGTLTVNRCTISQNYANRGGGIFNTGSLTVSNSTISDNFGRFSTGGIYNPSGAVASVSDSTISGNSSMSWVGGMNNDGQLTVTRCTLTNNRGRVGGGMFNNAALTITDSTFWGNSTISNGDGGGFVNYINGTASVNRCTFAYNSAARSGGGIANLGSLTVTNSTFFGNTAVTSGGGVYAVNYGAGYSATTHLTNCTISGNRAGAGGGIHNPTRKFTTNNTIVAGNMLTNGTTASDIAGVGSTKGSNNLVSTGGADGLSSRSNLLGVAFADVRLGALADNGGPTQTMALLAGSRAIDAGSNSLAAGMTTDQRLLARIVNGKVDIGAYEVQN